VINPNVFEIILCNLETLKHLNLVKRDEKMIQFLINFCFVDLYFVTFVGRIDTGQIEMSSGYFTKVLTV